MPRRQKAGVTPPKIGVCATSRKKRKRLALTAPLKE
jgi:hypothetical protein